MSKTKENNNYNYLQQKLKNDNKKENLFKKTDSINLPFHMNNILTNKNPLTTISNYISTRGQEQTTSKMSSQSLNPFQNKLSTTLTNNFTKLSSNNITMHNLKETRANFATIDSTESSFKKNSKTQIKELNVT